MSVEPAPAAPLGLRFARCPACSRWRAVVRRVVTDSPVRLYRTRRHGDCGIVNLPPDVELRDL
jgi:hypothetical protein